MKKPEFNIPEVDTHLRPALQQKIDAKTKPLGALGRLEDIALKVGLIQQSLSPELLNPVVAIFAGDHGIAAQEPVSAFPQEVTAQMVRNYVRGGAAVNVFCRLYDITPKIIDAGVNGELSAHAALINRSMGKGTQNYAEEPAMSQATCLKAIQAGAALVREWHEDKTNVIALGEMGIGNTASASIITSLVTGTPIEACTGKGTGLDAKGVNEKAAILRAAIQKHTFEHDSLSILATFGGFEIAMMMGAMLQAAEDCMLILIDGFIVTAALLLAAALYPSILDYTFFAHESEEAGHQIQLRYVNTKPLLRLNMRLGEGTGAVLAYPLLQAAVAFLNDMASFDDAGVSKREGE